MHVNCGLHVSGRLGVPSAGALARTVQLRVLRWFVARGLLEAATAAAMHGGGRVASPATAPSASRPRTEVGEERILPPASIRTLMGG